MATMTEATETQTGAATVTTRDLAAALKQIRSTRVRGNRSPAAILAVHTAADADGLTLTTTNLSASTTARVPAPGAVPFTALIPWEVLATLAGQPGAVTLTPTEASTTAGTLQWPMQDPDDFPPLPMPAADAPSVTLAAPVLAAMLPALRVAVAQDDSRPILKGALVDGGWIEATDNTRLVRHPFPTGLPRHVVPGTALDALAAALGTRPAGRVTWQVDGPRIYLVTDTATVVALAQEGRYPDYERVLPEAYPVRAVVDRTTFARALKAVAATAKQDRAGSIRVTWTAGGLTLAAEAVDVGRTVLDVPAAVTLPEGAPVTASFTPAMLLDAVKTLPAKAAFTLAWSGKEMPAAAMQGDLLHVMMPMRDIV